jgi:Mn2+/Fe2+ NRAMP family transporter
VQPSNKGDKKKQRSESLAALWRRVKRHPLAKVGPGLITGVADDDPSGIATYSQAGAQFGLNMLWTMPLAYPLMAAIQAMCAQIGRVTGRDWQRTSRAHFHPSCSRAWSCCC